MAPTDPNKAHFDAPFMPVQAADKENMKLNALNYIAAHMGRISASLVKVEERLAAIEKIQKSTSD